MPGKGSKIEVLPPRKSDGKVRYRGRPWDAERSRPLPTQTFDTEQEAYAYVKQAEGRVDADYADAGVPVRCRRRRMSWPEFCTHWIDTYNTGERASRRTRATHARMLAQAWPDARVDEITEPMVLQYMQAMDDGVHAGVSPTQHGKPLAKGSQRGRLAVLRAIMRRALDEGQRPDDPTRNVVGPKVPRSEPRDVDPEALRQVAACMPEWVRPGIMLAMQSGLRIGEVCGLQWGSVSVEMRRVRVRHVVLPDDTIRDYPKGKDVLTVPISVECAEALAEHRARYPGKAR